ncbi:MAG: aldehyde ferredoxin oxidoreductase C-terminal domain-containing protein [Desulfobacterales bacterium]|nr:aldehyde ferredoxin oxidoreductase C-terminal domain-containing protein [Desulfobacterales bacterium]
MKAIVLSGDQPIIPYDKDEMNRLSKKSSKWILFQPPFVSGPATSYLGALMRVLPTQLAQDGMLYKILLRRWGTVSMNQMSIEMGDSPVKNWMGSSVDWDASKSIGVNPDVFTNAEIVKYHCYSCPLGCGGICKMSGKYKETHKPEYESVICLGALCMNEDADSIFYMNEVLNRAGMDTISAGHALAFAIECYEKGIITDADTGGIKMTWGNTDGIVAMLHKMVDREGFGDVLADGVKVASQKIGKNSKEFAIHAGGQELAAHDGRNDPGFAVHYSLDPTPGRHTIGSQLYYEMYQLWKEIKGLPKAPLLYHKNHKYLADEEKAKIGAACSKYMNVLNAIGACLFGALTGIKRVPFFAWINAATGWNKTPEEYMEIGERIQVLKQAFNVKHGIEPKHNFVTPRALGVPAQTEGANKGRTVLIDKLSSDYWEQFGFDRETGKPKPESIKKFSIDEPLRITD